MKAWLAPLIIIVALGGLAFWAHERRAEPTAQLLACADPVKGCRFTHNGRSSEVRFSSVPKPLEPFAIDLFAPATRKVTVQFQMNGMDMGFNLYDLKADQGGMFKAKSILLPVCTQSRTDWIAFLTLDDQVYQINFQAR